MKRILQEPLKFLQQLKKKGGCFLFDYDGTLAPFKKERMQALPYAGAVKRLTCLLNESRARVIIISGRSIEALKKLLVSIKPLPELYGSHGLEHLSAEGIYSTIPLDVKSLRGIEAAKQRFKKVPYFAGLLQKPLEIKPFGVALHWRGASQSERKKMEEAFRKEAESLCRTYPLQIFPFDGGLEIRPYSVSKGHVVQRIVADLAEDVPVAYFGDDLPDESAFEALGKRGLKVLVRKQDRKSLADIRLQSTKELFLFLDQCTA